MMMTSRPAYSEPSKTTAIHGEVVLEGPDGAGLAFTPAAARETGRRLIQAADEAEQQNPVNDDDE